MHGQRKSKKEKRQSSKSMRWIDLNKFLKISNKDSSLKNLRNQSTLSPIEELVDIVQKVKKAKKTIYTVLYHITINTSLIQYSIFKNPEKKTFSSGRSWAIRSTC